MRFASSEVIDLFINNQKALKAEDSQKANACLACRSANIRFIFQKNFFEHWHCRQCGFVFVNPRPSEADLVKMYQSLTYFTNRTELFEIARIRDGMSFNITMNVDEWYGTIANRVKRHSPGGAMLDVGGGSGRFLKFIKDKYPEFDPTLIEVNEELCRVASEVFGLKTFNGTIEELQLEGRKFDVVVSIATIEHISDPASYLATIRRVMNDGGILYMTMPRIGVLSRTISTSAIYDVFPPLHLNFFDVESMQAIIHTNNIPFAVNETFQSHGPVFHLGHAFCKHNYIVEDLVVEEKYEAPGRAYPHRDESRLSRAICSGLDKITAVVTPFIRLLDGERVAHFVLQAR
jgi:ubiquinone/menaquinone biosynthesis C-methylase UbiE